MTKRAVLRCCANSACMWVFKRTKPDMGCPKCGFAHYGARYVFGDKAYTYEKTQKPWYDEQMSRHSMKLQQEIIDSQPESSKWPM